MGRFRQLSILGVSVGLAAFSVGLAAVVVTPAQAAAAPPNDTFAGAITIGTVPSAVDVDTTEATTDVDDSNANVSCGAPATEHSVWYSITATADAAYLANVKESAFPAGVIVVTGTPDEFTLVACGPDAVAFAVKAGTTYHLILFDPAPAGTGGPMHLSLELTDPPPTIDIAVNPTGTYDDASGTATVSGTVACVGLVDSTVVQGELRQPVGQAIVVGYFQAEVQCDGQARPWTAEVPPFYPGTEFGDGGTVSMTLAVACGPHFCGTDYDERSVTLAAP